jgi:hypothetical protein
VTATRESVQFSHHKRKTDLMAMRTFGIRFIVMGFMLALAACQTTGGPSPAAITKLQAAGYESSTVFANIVVKDVRVTGMYLCPEAKCNALALVAFGSLSSPPSALGITAEEQIRRRLFPDATLKGLLGKVVRQSASEEKVKVSFGNFRQFSDAQRAGFSFSMNIQDKTGFSLKILANATVVGNEASFVMSFSPKEAQARRGLALAQN